MSKVQAGWVSTLRIITTIFMVLWFAGLALVLLESLTQMFAVGYSSASLTEIVIPIGLSLFGALIFKLMFWFIQLNEKPWRPPASGKITLGEIERAKSQLFGRSNRRDDV